MEKSAARQRRGGRLWTRSFMCIMTVFAACLTLSFVIPPLFERSQASEVRGGRSMGVSSSPAVFHVDLPRATSRDRQDIRMLANESMLGERDVAVAFVACGNLAETTMTTDAVRSVRNADPEVPIFVLLEGTQRWYCLVAELQGIPHVYIIHSDRGECEQRFLSNLRKQDMLTSLLVDWDFTSVLYLDSDVRVTPNFRQWRKEQHVVEENAMLFASERPGEGKKSAVNGGAIWVERQSLPCIKMLQTTMMSTYGEIQAMQKENEDADLSSFKFNPRSDQQTMMWLVGEAERTQDPHPICKYNRMPLDDMCFARQPRCIANEISMRSSGLPANNAVFMHYTSVSHDQNAFRFRYQYDCNSWRGWLDSHCYVSRIYVKPLDCRMEEPDAAKRMQRTSMLRQRAKPAV